jgi:hypothetical protein
MQEVWRNIHVGVRRLPYLWEKRLQVTSVTIRGNLTDEKIRNGRTGEPYYIKQTSSSNTSWTRSNRHFDLGNAESKSRCSWPSIKIAPRIFF